MTDTVSMALIVAGGTAASSIIAVFAQWLMAHQLARNISASKAEDYRRLDEVRNQAISVERQTSEVARLLVESNEAVARTAKTQSSKLDQIHTLVNSNMTAALESERTALVNYAALLHETIEGKKATGLQASELTIATLKTTRDKIVELEAKLAERKTNTLLAEQQLAQGDKTKNQKGTP